MTTETEEAKDFVSTKLAELPEDAMLDKGALAEILDVCARTLQHMVARREIPPGISLGNRKVWFAGKVREFLKRRADEEADQKLALERKFLGGEVGSQRGRQRQRHEGVRNAAQPVS